MPDKKYIKQFNGTNQISQWKSNRISKESIENITKSDSLFAPPFFNHYILPDLNFNGHCLINNNISIPKKVIIMYISYVLNQLPRDLNTEFTLGSCLFGSVKQTNNAGLDKCYGIRFHFHSEFLLPDGSMGNLSLFLELI